MSGLNRALAIIFCTAVSSVAFAENATAPLKQDPVVDSKPQDPKAMLESVLKAIAAKEYSTAQFSLWRLQDIYGDDAIVKDSEHQIMEMHDNIRREDAEAALRQVMYEQHKSLTAATSKEIEEMTGGKLKSHDILKRLLAAFPEGVWIHESSAGRDSLDSRFYRTSLGDRFEIKFVAYVTGQTPMVMCNRTAVFMRDLREQFGVPRDGSKPSMKIDGTFDKDWGTNKTLGARFDPPRLIGTQYIEHFQLPPKATNIKTAPSPAVDGRFSFTFELPSKQ